MRRPRLGVRNAAGYGLFRNLQAGISGVPYGLLAWLPPDLSRRSAGVYRDFACLAIAICRAHGVPARCVSAYACRLSPPDFHAVSSTERNVIAGKQCFPHSDSVCVDTLRCREGRPRAVNGKRSNQQFAPHAC